MELTWIAIAASLCMALAGILVFIAALNRDWFRNLEDVKYQVFWSDLEELVNRPDGKAGIHEEGIDQKT